MSLGTKQIHIAFLGYERERIYRPPIESGANKVVLLAHIDDVYSDVDGATMESPPENDISKGRACRDEVVRKLTNEEIQVEITSCDFFDLNSAVLGVGDVITRYQSDNAELYLNITTGSKITAIAGVIAATATDAEPYYVPANSYIGEQIATDIGEPQVLPQYPFTSPHQDFLRVMEFISQESAERGYVIKKDIVEFAKDLPILSEHEISRTRHYYEPTEKKVIKPLRDWGYLNLYPRGDEKRYSLSKEGENVMEILSFMLQ